MNLEVISSDAQAVSNIPLLNRLHCENEWHVVAMLNPLTRYSVDTGCSIASH